MKGILVSAIYFVSVFALIDANANDAYINLTSCEIEQHTNATTCTVAVEWFAPSSGGGGGGNPPYKEPRMQSQETIDYDNNCLYHNSTVVSCQDSGSTTVAATQGHNFFRIDNGQEINIATEYLYIQYKPYTAPFNWSTTSHNEIVGDFEGDGDLDIFVQPKSKESQAGVFPQEETTWYNDAIHKNWTGAHPNLSIIEDWSSETYKAVSGNFNASPGDEVLLLGKKSIVLLHGDVVTPIVIYPEVRNAIVEWGSSGNISYSSFNFDKDPERFEFHTADLDGNGYDEIFLQAKEKGQTSFILSNNGQLIQTLKSGYLNIDWSAASYSAQVAAGEIRLTALTSADDDNVAYINSNGNVTGLRDTVTQPLISGKPPRYFYKRDNFSFQPTIVSEASVTFSINGEPSWMSLNTSKGILTGIPKPGPGNETYSIALTAKENKSHTIPGNMSFKLRVLESFTIEEKDFDVYVASNGDIYLRSKDGLDYYRIVRDGDEQWIEKITAAEFNSLSLNLDSDYQVLFNDFNDDGDTDLVVFPSLVSGNSYLVSSISSFSHYVAVGDASEFLIPNAPLEEDVVLDSDYFGSIRGGGEVSGGVAQYTLPISLPPGRNKMMPSLSLDYSSNRGMGIAGVGWTMTGQSKVTLCGKTVAQDDVSVPYGYDSHDKLCLDGQRLINVGSVDYGKSGAKYRTEVDRFVLVKQFHDLDSANSYFKVYSAGKVKTYGLNNNSRQFYKNINKPHAWALNVVSDYSNNTIHYKYNEGEGVDSGEYLLTGIYYTGYFNSVGDRKIEFKYEDNQHNSVFYNNGGSQSFTKRLYKINVIHGEVIRSYELNYETSLATGKSLLQSVVECGYTDSTTCKVATDFEWLSKAPQYQFQKLNIPQVLIDEATCDGSECTAYDPKIDVETLADYDADGIPELRLTIVGRKSGSVSTGAGQQYELLTGSYLVKIDKNFNVESWIDYSQLYDELAGNGNEGYQTGVIDKSVDFNLDGLADFARKKDGKLVFLTWNGGDFSLSSFTESSTNLDISQYRSVRLNDFNNDGKVDIHAVKKISDSKYSVYYIENIGELEAPSFSQPVYLHDFLIHNCCNSADTVIEKISSIEDFNNDGFLDLIYERSSFSYKNYSIYINQARNNDEVSFTRLSYQDFGISENHKPEKVYHLFYDLNADGMNDYLFIPKNSNKWHYQLNNGLSFESVVQTNQTEQMDGCIEWEIHCIDMPKYANLIQQFDYDNDGHKELLVKGDLHLNYCDYFSVGIGDSNEPMLSCSDQNDSRLNTEAIDIRQFGGDFDYGVYRANVWEFEKGSNNGSYQIVSENTDILITGSGAAVYLPPGDFNNDGINDLVIGLDGAKTTHNGFYVSGTHSIYESLDTLDYYQGRGAYLILGIGSGTDIDDPNKKVDALSSVTNGNGIVETWKYAALSSQLVDDSFYQTDKGYLLNTASSTPYFHFTSSMNVVSSYTKSNGVSGVNSQRYRYRGAVYEPLGRGFQGFRTIIMDSPTGIDEFGSVIESRTVSDFYQVFPLSGKVEQVRTCLVSDNDDTCSNRTPISKVEIGYITHKTHNGAGNHDTHWVIPAKTIKTTNDLSTRAQLSKTTSYAGLTDPGMDLDSLSVSASAYDDYGNVLQSTQIIDSGFGTHTVTTMKDFYPPDENNWWVNKLRTQSVTTSVLNGLTPDVYNSTLDREREVSTLYTWTPERLPDVVTTSVTQGSGKSVSVHTDYSIYGLPTTVTTSSLGATSRVVTTGYSSDGYFAESMTQVNFDNSALNQTVTSSVNPIHGQPDWVEDANGNRTHTYYDAFGRVERVEADGMPTAYKRYYWCRTGGGSYCDSNTVYQVATVQAGNPTVYEHKDMFNRSLLAETVGFDGTSIYAYTTVNVLGQKLFESVPSYNRSTEYGTYYNSYDALGRLTSRTTHNAGGTLPVSYDYQGHTTYIQVGDLPLMSRTHSGTGQLMRTMQSNNGVESITQYAYDGMGNLIVMRDANNNDITAQYNALGQKEWVNDPNLGQKTFTYTGFGEVRTELDANGNTTRYEYDSLGRLTERLVKNNSENYFNSEATFVFDTAMQGDTGLCLGLPVSEHKTGENAERYYGYDDKCRPISQTDVIDGESFTLITHIDANYGRVKGKTFPNGLTVAYAYNSNGYLNRTYNPANDYTYRQIDGMDEWGQWDEARLGNNTLQIDRNYYEASGQMLNSALYSNNRNTLLQSMGYDVDRYGNLQNMFVDNHNGSSIVRSEESYIYDHLHRLTESSRIIDGVSLPIITYDYDKAGNFRFKSDFSTVVAGAYEYGDEDRANSYNAGPNAVHTVTLSNSGGTRSYQYDNNGNLIVDKLDGSTLRTINYNAFNKPTLITVNNGNKLNPWDSANTSASSTEFFYGANQMRYKQIKTAGGDTETTLYIGKAYEEVRTINKTVKKVFLDDIAQITETITTSGTEHAIGFFHKDQLGSTTAIVDENGNVMEARSFDAFGKPRKEDLSDNSVSAIGSELYKRGFTDHEHLDDSQLIHMNGRAYDYNLGRFISVDPIIQRVGNSQGINPYSYIMNNPLSGTDPSGYELRSNIGNTMCGARGPCDSVGLDSVDSISVNGKGEVTVDFTDNTSSQVTVQNSASNTPSSNQTTVDSSTVTNEQTVSENSESNTSPNEENGFFSSAWNSIVNGYNFIDEATTVDSLRDSLNESVDILNNNANAALVDALNSGDLSSWAAGFFWSATATTLDFVTPTSGLDAFEITGVGKGAQLFRLPTVTNYGGSIRNVNKVGGKQNCANCSIATDATLAGNPASALNSGLTNKMEVAAHFGRKFGSMTSLTRIEAQMVKAGNGSRGVIFAAREGKAGHFFNIVNQNGTVRFLDGQTGKAFSSQGQNFIGYQLLKTN